MASNGESHEPTELIFLPGPSWTPALLALGVALIVVGIYGEGFLFRGYIYGFAGFVVFLLALRSAIAGAVRDHFRLPRRQRIRSAVLPAASLRPPEHRP